MMKGSGAGVGAIVGAGVGAIVGALEGDKEGAALGMLDGANDGDSDTQNARSESVFWQMPRSISAAANVKMRRSVRPEISRGQGTLRINTYTYHSCSLWCRH